MKSIGPMTQWKTDAEHSKKRHEPMVTPWSCPFLYQPYTACPTRYFRRQADPYKSCVVFIDNYSASS